MLALVMEFVATALNATQGLIKGLRLLTLLRNSLGTAAVLAAFEQLMIALPWAVYDVWRRCRRAPTASQPRPIGAHPRRRRRRREPLLLADGRTTAERFLTVAPATAINKTGPAFPKAWAAASEFHLL